MLFLSSSATFPPPPPSSSPAAPGGGGAALSTILGSPGQRLRYPKTPSKMFRLKIFFPLRPGSSFAPAPLILKQKRRLEREDKFRALNKKEEEERQPISFLGTKCDAEMVV
mmetsp:Transcript_52295/g.106591  ORF Transcript_52295/g.106591 Transcript_52295/m.106591 type:complete len:111 (+) Transcript_52295:302-634(+)|eukprot:CAMPEP_0181332634 /NCGR_PEP_ID=MMETSP1101-20121128/25215_1 /TAXON_ID=46948 /ORGANISM="Rhodomonas abbreviata, Strain Caron Lab Isolate" /LENGTH=110 /DNA_ID=CAMNT_0023442325 /DNA_START=286 /DNA_END=618 /DNA_ORIENTATION=+